MKVFDIHRTGREMAVISNFVAGRPQNYTSWVAKEGLAGTFSAVSVDEGTLPMKRFAR
jgi:hypothetical protein